MPDRAPLLILLTLTLSFGPGFFVLRGRRWEPLELLSGAVALSLVFLYVAGFAVFALGLPAYAYTVIVLAGGALTVAAAPEAVRLFRRPIVARTLAAFGLLTLWVLLAQALIRHYSGGDWCCDWFEHYQRTLHLVNRGPSNFRFIDRYALTARPPLMNVVAGVFLQQVGQTFALYQVVFSLLSLLIFFPCCLLAALLVPQRPVVPLLVAVMLAFNPMFFMNATFPWTKVTSAMFVIAGVCFFVAGRRRRDGARVSMAFVCLSAGVLVHYSGGPYTVVLAGAYLILAWRWRLSAVRAMGVLVPGALLGASWFGWAIAEYGVAGSLLMNPSVEGTSAFTPWQNVVRIASNTFHTFRPYVWPGHAGDTPLRLFADRTFTFYQENLLGGIGSVAAIVVIVFLARGWIASWWRPDEETRVWVIFIPLTLLIGIAVDGETSESGVANICLQPLVYMAVAWLASRFPLLDRLTRVLLAIGVTIDLLLGVLLQLHMEHEMKAWARTPNWDLKFDNGLVYLGDHLFRAAGPIQVAVLLLAVGGTGYVWWQALSGHS